MMKRKTLWSLLAVTTLTFSMVTAAAASAYPPAGEDVLASPAFQRIRMLPPYGGMVLDGRLNGPVVIQRSDPYPMPDPPLKHHDGTEFQGNEVIDTTMTSMNVIGTVGGMPAQMVLQSPTPESPGMIIDTNPDPDDGFPAYSFFDIFFEITIQNTPFGLLTLHNNDPLRMHSTIHAIPPDLERDPYVAEGWIPIGQYVPRKPDAELRGVPTLADDPLVLYDRAGEPVAELIVAIYPEPGTLGLLAFGSLALLRRRR